MKNHLLFLLFIIFNSFLLSANDSLSIDKKAKRIYVIKIQQEINSTSWRHVQKGFKIAEEIEPTAIIIHMNTYGGELLYADSIRTKILNSSIPIYAFIDNNAASAGALISIACDKIFMRKGGNIGAATVVDSSGEQMPDKYQSYMRGIIRATAEAQGKETIVSGGDTTYIWKRDPQIAEAMVDDRVVIPNLVDSGKILTFTSEEALKYNYCDGIAESIDEIATVLLNMDNFEVITFEPTAMDSIFGFLTGTMFRGILIMLIIAGIYFELQTPGLGFPSLIAIGAAILYFAPLYIDGLAANWEILIFVVGLVLVALELFVIPGFGIAGISGITLIVAGLVLSLIGNDSFNFESVETKNITSSIVTVLSSLVLSGVLIIYISSRIGKRGLFRKVALETKQDIEDGYIGVPTEQKQLLGKTGIAHTDLRPSGKVKIDRQIYDAISEDGFIEKDEQILVYKYETSQVYVGKLTNS